LRGGGGGNAFAFSRGSFFLLKKSPGCFFTQILHEETFALYTALLSWGL